MKNRIITTVAVVGALILVAVGAYASPSTRPAFASVDTQRVTAQNNLDNCRLLAAHSNGSQRDRANTCIQDQTRILVLLSPTPTPSRTATPTIPPTTAPATSPPIVTTPPPTSPPPPVRPDASNTGVPAGMTLIHTSGRTITVPGTVINGEDIDGCLTIAADSVTIRNSRIRCSTEPINARTRAGVLIEDVEADCLFSPGTGMVGNFTARRVNIHGCENGMSLDGRNLVERSYIHDLYEQMIPEIGHTDGIQVFIGAGSPITIIGNWIENMTPDGTSAIIADDRFDLLTISGNWLHANAYFPLRCPTSGMNNTITDNIIWGSILHPPVQWTECTDERWVSGNVDNNGQPL